MCTQLLLYLNECTLSYYRTSPLKPCRPLVLLPPDDLCDVRRDDAVHLVRKMQLVEPHVRISVRRAHLRTEQRLRTIGREGTRVRRTRHIERRRAVQIRLRSVHHVVQQPMGNEERDLDVGSWERRPPPRQRSGV